MAKNAYYAALEEIFDDVYVSPPPATTMKRADIEAAIADISAQLKGSMSNVERIWLMEDRAILRKQLAAATD